ncbi:MAG: ankyrin repeat domain-containing protein [Alphaproteobacteria bacterium]|nr:ankyrin repeat domain-containing protein [Alphaproteobacteria bacterium]
MTDREPDIYFLPPVPSQQEVDAFVIAAGSGKESEAAAFLDKYPGAVNQKNIHGNTALINAAWMGQSAMVEFLLKKGAAVNGKSDTGLTPLMAAAWRGRTWIIKPLIDKGASPDDANNKGKTALMLAREETHPETATLIEECAEIQRRRARDLADAERKKITDGRLERLKKRRPPKPPFKNKM